MSFARLYRRSFGCTQLRDQIRLRARPAARVSGARCGESRCGPWAWLSGCRWLVAIRGQRQSRCAHSACAYLCIAHPCGVAIVSHRVFAKPSKAVLAAVVFTAVLGLVDIRTLSRMWRISKADFYAATIALAAVLLLGILQGILLAAAASVLILLARASQPHVAFLGRIPGTSSYSDLARHPENEQLPHVIVFRPEASLLYVNAEFVSQTVLERLTRIGKASIRTIVCDLSASPYMDLAGSRMLRLLYTELAASGIALRILGARGRVRDLLRADGLGDIVSDRGTKLETVIGSSA